MISAPHHGQPLAFFDTASSTPHCQNVDQSSAREGVSHVRTSLLYSFLACYAIRFKKSAIESISQRIQTTMAHNEHRIFHVAEMLEAILHKLPQKDLLLSKAVCKLWNETIKKSNPLQRALYFILDGAGRFIVGRGLLLLPQRYV